MKSRFQLKKLFKKIIPEKKKTEFVALLGNSAGAIKADNNNNVYIIDFNGNEQIVKNTKVPPYRRFVYVDFIGESTKLLEVKRFVDAYPKDRPIEVPNHAKHHEWGGVDQSWIAPEQILSGIAIPDETEPLKIWFIGFVYYLNGFHLIDNFQLDLSSYIPEAGALYILVSVDENRAISILEGDIVASKEIIEYEDIPNPPYGKKPLFAVKMYFGQTRIWKTKTRKDVIDLRDANLNAFSTGINWNDIIGKPEFFPVDFSEVKIVVHEDLLYQIDGSETHFTINVTDAPPTIIVYLNGLRMRQSDVILDTDTLGFTIDPAPLTTDVLEAEYLAIPLTDDDENILTDDNGYIITL